MKNVLLVSSLALLTLGSCRQMNRHSEKGDGRVTTQTRKTGSFQNVEVSSSIQLYVTQDSSYSVKVEVDGNLQQYVEVYEDGSTLKIRQANNTSLDPTGDVKVYVSAPMYKHLGASGACNIIGQNKLSSASELDLDLSGSCDVNLDVDAPKISVGMSGACSTTLKGMTKDLHVEGSGSTELRAFGLMTENADLDFSGSGDAEVYASVKLNASTSGASSIVYKGAANVTSDVSGAGSVKKVD